MRRLYKAFTSLALFTGLAVGTPAVASAAGCTEPWGGKGSNPTAFGLYWGSTYLLDVNEYLGCWTTPPAASGYDPVKGQQIVLATFGMWVQQSATVVSPFRLQSLTLGSGWTNNISLLFTGYRGADVWTDTKVLNVSDGLLTWNFGGREFDYFTIHSTYDKSTSTAIDPYQSWEYNKQASGVEEPYQTFYVSGVTTMVPEPGTFSLVAVGLVGLAGAARRRRSKQ